MKRGLVTARRVLPMFFAAVYLTGCASAPQRGSIGAAAPADRDGPEANPPPDLARVPDAEPKLEPIRSGGPNKPYDVFGKRYVPVTQDAPYSERGPASWYGRKFQGKPTSSGELYNMYAMTAAHPTLPIPSYARIRNPANGREVVVRINDRGPFHSSRIVDLSYTAALKLDVLRGVTPVELQRITFDDIRTGAWRRSGDAVPTVPEPRVAATRGNVVDGAVTVPLEAPVVVPVLVPVLVPAAAPMVAPVVLATAADSPPAASASAPDDPATILTATLAASPPARVADAPAARAFTAPARGFWVQLGAFRARDGAESFHQRVVAEMDWLSPLLAVFDEASMFRLQAGPYPSRDEARGVAERVRDGLKLVPVVVERR